MKPERDFLNQIWGGICDRYNSAGFRLLTPGEKAGICLTDIYSDVQNGGFETYYWNKAGDRARHAPALFELIGAPELASIVRQANMVFGRRGPLCSQFLRRFWQMKRFNANQKAALDSLTTAFFVLPYDAQERFEDWVLKNMEHFQYTS